MVDVFIPAQHHQGVGGAQPIVAAGGHVQGTPAVPDGDDVHAVGRAHVQLPDGAALPGAGDLLLHDAVVLGQLDKIEDVRVGQPPGQLQAHLVLRENDLVGPDPLQHPPVGCEI